MIKVLSRLFAPLCSCAGYLNWTPMANKNAVPIDLDINICAIFYAADKTLSNIGWIRIIHRAILISGLIFYLDFPVLILSV